MGGWPAAYLHVMHPDRTFLLPLRPDGLVEASGTELIDEVSDIVDPKTGPLVEHYVV